MAGAQLRWNVSCGVTEERKTATIMYKIPDPQNSITWEWVPTENNHHIAEMIALQSNRGHRSTPVPNYIYQNLGQARKSKDGNYYKVVMSLHDGVSIHRYFDD